jgi:hypothetical protein
VLVQREFWIGGGELLRLYLGECWPESHLGLPRGGRIFERVFQDGSLTGPPRGVQTVNVPAGGGSIFELRLAEPGDYPFVSSVPARVGPEPGTGGRTALTRAGGVLQGLHVTHLAVELEAPPAVMHDDLRRVTRTHLQPLDLGQRDGFDVRVRMKQDQRRALDEGGAPVVVALLELESRPHMPGRGCQREPTTRLHDRHRHVLPHMSTAAPAPQWCGR